MGWLFIPGWLPSSPTRLLRKCGGQRGVSWLAPASASTGQNVLDLASPLSAEGRPRDSDPFSQYMFRAVLEYRRALHLVQRVTA